VLTRKFAVTAHWDHLLEDHCAYATGWAPGIEAAAGTQAIQRGRHTTRRLGYCLQIIGAARTCHQGSPAEARRDTGQLAQQGIAGLCGFS